MKKLTVFIVTLAMIATLSMSAAASEWKFYGSARVTTFSWDDDYATGSSTLGGDSSDRDTQWALQGNSRIGAKVKVSDTLSGHFEYSSAPGLRLLYGIWTFGGGSLTAGQFYSPMNFFLSKQAYNSDASMFSTGGLFSGRNQGLQLQFGDLKVALISPSTSLLNLSALTSEVDTTLPKIEISYHLAFGKSFIDFTGGYNTYDIDTTGSTYDIDCYAVGVGGGINIGQFYIKSSAWIGQNVGTYGINHMTVDDPTITATAVNDNDSYGLLLVAGAKINDMISLETGIGYTESELDDSNAATREDDNLAYYLQAIVNLAPGVSIVPEIGVIDYKDTAAGVDEGDRTYFGIKWQINF